MDSLDGFRLSGASSTPADRLLWDTALRSLHSSSPTALKQPTYTTLDAIQTVAGWAWPRTTCPATARSTTRTASSRGSLRDVARMIKDEVGVQVVCIDYGNWDMHTDLGPVRPGG